MTRLTTIHFRRKLTGLDWTPLGRLAGLRVFLSVFVMLGFDAVAHWTFRHFGLDENTTAWPSLSRRMDLFGACFVGAAYGFGRLHTFHPALNGAYRRWLALTPWDATKDLPLGPVHFVWIDAVVLATLWAFVTFHGHADGLWPVVSAMAGYLLPAMSALVLADRPREAMTIFVLAGGVLALFPELHLVACLLGAGCLVAWSGWRRSWATFPWKLDEPGLKSRGVGAPLSMLSPAAPKRPRAVSVRRFQIGSALVAWAVFCLLAQMGKHPDQFPDLRRGVLGACVMTTGIAAGLRWMVYRAGTTAPISLWGRLVTGRFLIPGFDRHLLAPLAILILGFSGTAVVAVMEIPTPAIGAIVAFGLAALATLLPPSYSDWRLTGRHHLFSLELESKRRAARQ